MPKSKPSHSSKLPPVPAPWECVPISDGNDFLSLWPHRFDFLVAQFPSYPDHSPQWLTERRYPLPDRRILAREYLYGVRFGPMTSYVMLDIDRGSFYHPANDALAIDRIQEVLDEIGLVSFVAVTSSYSEGIHLYFPFDEPQKSWYISQVVCHHLQSAGFVLSPGQLEVFPNPREYSAKLSLYHGHRLPLQIGSYMLNRDFQPMYSSHAAFFQAWKWAENRNELNHKQMARIHKSRSRRHTQSFISDRAAAFLYDLEIQIEDGWTGRGQTNGLLSAISRIGYIFHHAVHGGDPLKGDALVDYIVATARSLPGYSEYCGHQHEIVKRATHWARAIEASSRYYPYKLPYLKITPAQIEEAKHQAAVDLLCTGITRDELLVDGITLVELTAKEEAYVQDVLEKRALESTQQEQPVESTQQEQPVEPAEQEQPVKSAQPKKNKRKPSKKKTPKKKRTLSPDSPQVKAAEDARSRIALGVAHHLREGSFGDTITSRHSVLVKYCRTSVQTLYNNMHLWHPDECEIISYVRKPTPTPEPLPQDSTELPPQTPPQHEPTSSCEVASKNAESLMPEGVLQDSPLNKCLYNALDLPSVGRTLLGIFFALVTFFSSVSSVSSAPQFLYPGSSSFAFPIVQAEIQSRSTINNQQIAIASSFDRSNSNDFQRSNPKNLDSETFFRKMLDSGG